MINKEIEAFNLIKEFKNQFREKFDSFFYLKDKTSKWYKYFLNTVLMFSDEPDWDAKEFIRTNFEQRGKIYPSQLPNKYSWQIYQEYKENKKFSDEKNLIYILLEDFKKAKSYDFDLDKMAYIINNNEISNYFLSIFKPFVEYNKKNKVVSDLTLSAKRIKVKENKKLYDKLKEVLGDNFYG